MIFVFGSNLAGIHGKGAAVAAHKQHGAEWGVGRGLTGNAYALPTKDENLNTLPWAQVRENLREFVGFAKAHPDMSFALTPVGTGLAGYSRRELVLALQSMGLPENVYLTSSWITG